MARSDAINAHLALFWIAAKLGGERGACRPGQAANVKQPYQIDTGKKPGFWVSGCLSGMEGREGEAGTEVGGRRKIGGGREIEE